RSVHPWPRRRPHQDGSARPVNLAAPTPPLPNPPPRGGREAERGALGGGGGEARALGKGDSHLAATQCRAAHAKWAGRCEACGGWNTLVEETVGTGPAKSLAKSGPGKAKGRRLDFTGLSGDSRDVPRRITGIAEFDRVCGSGIVPGSALLV